MSNGPHEKYYFLLQTPDMAIPNEAFWFTWDDGILMKDSEQVSNACILWNYKSLNNLLDPMEDTLPVLPDIPEDIDEPEWMDESFNFNDWNQGGGAPPGGNAPLTEEQQAAGWNCDADYRELYHPRSSMWLQVGSPKTRSKRHPRDECG